MMRNPVDIFDPGPATSGHSDMDRLCVAIAEGVEPFRGDDYFLCQVNTQFGGGTVFVKYAAVPADSTHLQILNAKAAVQFAIDPFNEDGSMKSSRLQAKVTTQTMPKGKKARAKTGSFDQVVKHVVRAFWKVSGSSSMSKPRSNPLTSVPIRPADPRIPLGAGHRHEYGCEWAREHGYPEPNPEGARWLAKKYGLTTKEADTLASHPEQRRIVNRIERWREEHGFPAPDSSLVRGKLLDLLRSNPDLTFKKWAQQEMAEHQHMPNPGEPRRVLIKKYGSPDRAAIAEYGDDREWYYLSGKPVETAGWYVDTILGPAGKPPGVPNPRAKASYPLIRTTYDITTPESAEHGDFAESGWVDEEGEDMSPDEDETAVEKAVEFLRREGVTDDGSHFYPGIWYTNYEYGHGTRDYFEKGIEERRSYHLDGFTEAQEREIFEEIMGRRNPREPWVDVERSKYPDMAGRYGENDFQEGAAKALWASLFSSELENLREDGYDELADELGPGAGGDIMDVLPEIPKAAYDDAREFEIAVADANGVDLNTIIVWAQEADGVDYIDEEEFGHYLMMPALGEGVSWFDDHGDFDLKLPRWEQGVYVHNAMYDWLEHQKYEWDEGE
jgi:hypothetical protein